MPPPPRVSIDPSHAVQTPEGTPAPVPANTPGATRAEPTPVSKGATAAREVIHHKHVEVTLHEDTVRTHELRPAARASTSHRAAGGGRGMCGGVHSPSCRVPQPRHRPPHFPRARGGQVADRELVVGALLEEQVKLEEEVNELRFQLNASERLRMVQSCEGARGRDGRPVEAQELEKELLWWRKNRQQVRIPL